MKRTIVITATIIGALLIIIISSLYLLFRNKSSIATDKLSEVPVFTPTPIITVTQTPKEIIGKFVIIPNGYKLLTEDIKAIKEAQIKTVFLDNPSSDYSNTATSLLDGLIVEHISEFSKYSFCNFSNLAISSASATTTSNVNDYIAFTSCGADNKIVNILHSTCNVKDSKCQQQYLITLASDSYYYNSTNPLLALESIPELRFDSPFGTTILDWSNTTSQQLIQKHYSFEILNSAGKRIHATGKIAGQNQGDYFSPTFALNDQQLTVKLRIWYQYKGITFKSPLLLTSSFNFAKAITSPQANTTKVQQMSWIPDWGMSDGIESVKANTNKWGTISPVWFTPNKSGTINKEPTLNNSTLLSLLRKNNIKIIPTISTFDADILKEILNKNLSKHVSEIVKLVVNNNYDGIDLDYESTYENDKALLLQFITELAVQLHSQGKTLSFTALPKIDDRAIYGFLPQTHQAQDWKAIGAVVDEFRIMAYDFTSQGSLQPGPLSPYDWNETLIRYAIAQMPAEKVVLALPLYAHGWPKPKTSNLAGTNNDKSLLSGELKTTISPQHDNIAYIKSHSTYYRAKYDPVVKEVRAEFKYNGVERVMYYLDKTSVDRRIELAQKYGIKGICYWRIGGERL